MYLLKIVKFNFLILTDTVVSQQTADVTLGGIIQLNSPDFQIFFFIEKVAK
jgi:hypothetical protein